MCYYVPSPIEAAALRMAELHAEWEAGRAFEDFWYEAFAEALDIYKREHSGGRPSR